jgi:hypothetical protein
VEVDKLNNTEMMMDEYLNWDFYMNQVDEEDPLLKQV